MLRLTVTNRGPDMDTVPDTVTLLWGGIWLYTLWLSFLHVYMHSGPVCLGSFVCSLCVEVPSGALGFPFIEYLCYVNLSGS